MLMVITAYQVYKHGNNELLIVAWQQHQLLHEEANIAANTPFNWHYLQKECLQDIGTFIKVLKNNNHSIILRMDVLD